MATSLSMSHCKSWVEMNSFHSLACRNQRSTLPCISCYSEAVFYILRNSNCAHWGNSCCLLWGALPDYRDQSEQPERTPTHGLGTNHCRILMMKSEKRNSSSKEQFRAYALSLGSSRVHFQAALSLHWQQTKPTVISFLAIPLTRISIRAPPSINKTDLFCLRFASLLSFWPRSNTIIWQA